VIIYGIYSFVTPWLSCGQLSLGVANVVQMVKPLNCNLAQRARFSMIE